MLVYKKEDPPGRSKQASCRNTRRTPKPDFELGYIYIFYYGPITNFIKNTKGLKYNFIGDPKINRALIKQGRQEEEWRNKSQEINQNAKTAAQLPESCAENCDWR